MRTIKRDKQKRAFKSGYKAGLKGHSTDVCCFSDVNKRAEWLGGWRLGHVQHAAGSLFITLEE